MGDDQISILTFAGRAVLRGRAAGAVVPGKCMIGQQTELFGDEEDMTAYAMAQPLDVRK
jgi:hypothetical protein